MDREAEGHVQICIYEREKRKTSLELNIGTTDGDSNELDNEEDNLNRDPNFQAEVVEEALKIKKVNELLFELGEPLLKKPKKEKLKPDAGNKKNGDMSESWIEDLRLSIEEETSRYNKISLLTTVPLEWGVKKIVKEFHVSRRMARQARKLHADCGYAAHPQMKAGPRLPDLTFKKAIDFYLSDDASRFMPGIRDCVVVEKDGKRHQEQKRLLLFNIGELHTQFKQKFHDIKISLDTFRKQRPRQCIMAGQTGTHTVCVCKIHQNMKLKFQAIKTELTKKNIDFDPSYRNYFQQMICQDSNSNCYLLKCKKCPGTSGIINELKLLLENNRILDIQFNAWVSTDRYVK